MRILVFSDRYPPYYDGGYEIQCEKTVNELKLRGHEVMVLTTSHGLKKPASLGYVHRVLSECETNLIRDFYSGQFWVAFRREYRYRRNAVIVRQMIKEFSPDMVYAWRLPDVSLYSLLQVPRAIPVVFDIGDRSLPSMLEAERDRTYLPLRMLRFLFTGVWKFPKYPFRHMRFISAYLQRSFAADGIRPEHSVVIPRGIEEQGLQARQRSGAEIKLVYVGRIEAIKGIHIALKALYLLKHKKYQLRFDIIGSGDQEYIDGLNTMISEYGLNRSVFFLGKRPYEETLASYVNYDVFLCPIIRQEPFGNVFIEALAHGLPVVACNTGGVPEIIEDGVEGFLVEANNALLLADALEKIISDKDLRHRMGNNAIDKARRCFLQTKIVDRVEVFLEEAISYGK